MTMRPFCALIALAALAGCAQPMPGAAPAGAATPTNTASLGPVIQFQCGPTQVQTRFGQESMTLTLEGRTIALNQAISASGARYTGMGPDGPVEFWNTGRQAMLTVGPKAYPECQEAPGARN